MQIKKPIIRKCASLYELKKLTKEYTEIFKMNNIVIEKEVQISKELFEKISKNFFDYQKIINDNLNNMYCDLDDVWHTIILFCEEIEDMIIVESEGYSYLRYTAYISKKEYFEKR